MTGEQLRLQVDAYDLADLEELLSGSDDMHRVDEPPDGAHGEPVTLVVLAVTPLVVQAISLWLMKRRHEEVIETKVEKVAADGSRETLTLKVRVSDSTPVENVVEQVVTGLKVPTPLIDAAVGNLK